MRKQQKIWEEEHRQSSALPSLGEEQPSSAVVDFANYLKVKDITPPLKVVDIGCGKGRNAIYLAQLGFEVYGMDYIQSALNNAQKMAEGNGLENVHFSNTGIDQIWPFKDSFFDLAVDCFSSIDIETPEGREICRDEMLRVLKSGGLGLVSVVSVSDEIEEELIRTNPGPEKNSTIWPQNNKFQKDYDEGELRGFYKNFEILELKEITKKAIKLGRNYTATNLWVVLRKP